MKGSMADRIRVRTRLIIYEGTCSQRDLSRIAADGKYGPLADPGVGCKLECGGQIIAAGNLVRKKGRILFKILETEKEDGNG